MLINRAKARGKGGGKAGSPPPPPPDEPPGVGGVSTWGRSTAGTLGGGWAGQLGQNEGYRPWPEPVITIGNITELAVGAGKMLALDENGVMWTWGANNNGEQGFGDPAFEGHGIGSFAEDQIDPKKIDGGITLYMAKVMGPDKTGKTFNAPEGPLGPTFVDSSGTVLIKIAEISSAASERVVRTSDGRSLSWGANAAGQLGNGWWEGGEDPKAAFEGSPEGTGTTSIGSNKVTGVTGNVKPWEVGNSFNAPGVKNGTVITAVAGATLTIDNNATAAATVTLKRIDWKPTYAPWWVQTGPPQNQVAPGETNILKNVILVGAAKAASFWVTENPLGSGNTEVYYAGTPAGTGSKVIAPRYAVIDPQAVGITKIKKMAATSRSQMYLLEDGTVKVVGLCEEGVWGNGETEGIPPGGGPPDSKPRGQATVKINSTTNLTKIISIGKCEYSCGAVKDDGTVWVWGMNGHINPQTGVFDETGQLGLGPREAPALYATQITELGNDNLEIAGGPEIIGSGTLGGDCFIVRKADKTIRTWGKNNTIGNGNEMESAGNLGDETGENKNRPVKPNISNVLGIAAGPLEMAVIREGGPGPRTMEVTSPSSKKVLVKWSKADLTQPWFHGKDVEKWEVRFRRIEEDPTHLPKPAQEPMVKSPKLAASVTSWEGTLPAGWAGASNLIEAKLFGIYATEEPIPKPAKDTETGVTALAVAKKVTITWPAAVKGEPALYVNYRRTELNIMGRKEQWERRLVPASATSYNITMEPGYSEGTLMTGEEIEYFIRGTYEGPAPSRMTYGTTVLA